MLCSDADFTVLQQTIAELTRDNVIFVEGRFTSQQVKILNDNKNIVVIACQANQGDVAFNFIALSADEKLALAKMEDFIKVMGGTNIATGKIN